jgi:radical SAM enzyme (TIGR01210 family)
MCDLWKHTTDKELAPGLIPSQIRYALARLPVAKLLKLYNSGSFFDPGAIAVEDYPEISSLAEEFDRVLVESSTSFLGDNVLTFKDMISADLEVAIGLEIAHPQVLLSLNKQMTLDDFQRGVEFLGENGISTRAFILVRPPFLSEEEGVEWACRSIDFAFQSGVEVCSLIPVRGGNGALEVLATGGYFHEPVLSSLEKVLDYGVSLQKGNVFADLWDIERFSPCPECFEVRKERLEKTNLKQRVQAPIPCECK